jgi:hypothetical protein
MEAYQERVRKEKLDLDGKIERLNAFINDLNRFNGLPEDERVRLTRQENAMREYSSILGERIAAFK